MNDQLRIGGLAKEQIASWLSQLLIERGFEIRRNAIVERDGIRHKFDLVAETVLFPGARIRLGIIIVEHLIDTDFIEKLLGWIDELRFIKIIVVALNKVDHQAYSLASKYGIDIVIPPKELLSTEKNIIPRETGIETEYVEPKIGVSQVFDALISKVKPSIFRSTKCKLEKLALLYYPLIEINLELPVINKEVSEAEIVEGKIVFDGINGYLISFSGGHLSVSKEHGSLIEIPDDAQLVLKVLSEDRSAELAVLNARTRIDQHTLKSLLIELSMHGLVDIYGDLVELKGLDTKLFTDLNEWFKKHGLKTIKGEPTEDDKTIKLQHTVPLFKLEDIIKSLGAKIQSIKIIYYPLYVALVKEIRGEVLRDKLIVYDGITGGELEDFSILITSPELIENMKKINGYQLAKEKPKE